VNFLRHISGTYDNQAKFVANPRCALSRNYPVSGHPHKEELTGSGRMLRKIPFTGETRRRKRSGRSGLSAWGCFASWSHWTKYKLAVHIGFTPFREASLLLNANELLIFTVTVVSYYHPLGLEGHTSSNPLIGSSSEVILQSQLEKARIGSVVPEEARPRNLPTVYAADSSIRRSPPTGCVK
jgi:hypothetical protein